MTKIIWNPELQEDWRYKLKLKKDWITQTVYLADLKDIEILLPILK